MQITYKIAMAAGRDAGNKSMKSAGRTSWNEHDANVAAELTQNLLMKNVDLVTAHTTPAYRP